MWRRIWLESRQTQTVLSATPTSTVPVKRGRLYTYVVWGLKKVAYFGADSTTAYVCGDRLDRDRQGVSCYDSDKVTDAVGLLETLEHSRSWGAVCCHCCCRSEAQHHARTTGYDISVPSSPAAFVTLVPSLATRNAVPVQPVPKFAEVLSTPKAVNFTPKRRTCKAYRA